LTHDLGRAARWLALPTVALAAIALLAPGRFELAVWIYALILAGAIIAMALLALRRAFPPESTLHVLEPVPRPTARPLSLVRTHNAVVLGSASSFDLHYRLAPRLRTIAAGLLSSRRGVSLATDADRAAAILGPDAWELVRPDRPAPPDRLAAGIPPQRLAGVVDALERI
jgi:hypothetical protein